MTSDADRPAEMFRLDRATCLTLLTTQHVGRLVLPGDDSDHPEIVPVNYAASGEVITFRTHGTSRAASAGEQPAVFEVDMFDERTRSGWSVVVRGRLAPHARDEPRPDVETWAPGDRDEWMSVAVETVTGRLLRGSVASSTHAAGGYL
jgi:nitroimidazol reductase NimA-like FMN-containing flavoprotein (pyridoxamine 5'-phosphate oxidase superfamily)